ncbi:MAG TPA: hypothetical protein VN666_21695 [Nitrospira sp.]|nr:hypothetical protein [Nitrospira sp.]
MSNYPRVLERDRNGRETLWECSDCGKPFTKGWGSRCNACILAAERHAELIAAVKAFRDGEEFHGEGRS